MTDCTRCDASIGSDAETIGDEPYCESCAEKIRQDEADYESVLATYREQPIRGFFSVIEKEDRKASKAGMIERTRELEECDAE